MSWGPYTELAKFPFVSVVVNEVWPLLGEAARVRGDAGSRIGRSGGAKHHLIASRRNSARANGRRFRAKFAPTVAL